MVTGVTTTGTSQGEVAFFIDDVGEARPLPRISLADAGLKERVDLQRWVEKNPEIVGKDLLVVTTEFDQWELGPQPIKDRLDVLFLDADGALVVAELKRDQASDTTDLQALKYASYCSQLTVEDAIEEFARYHCLGTEAAQTQVLDHAPSLESGELQPIRVRLVASGFGPSVTTVVLWLRDLGLDIGCIEVTARQHPAGKPVVSARQLLPPPVADDYLVKRRRREAEEKTKEQRTRRRNSVVVLDEAGAVQPGDEIILNLLAFSADDRPKVQVLIDAEPLVEMAEWTGQGIKKALRWRRDGGLYSCTDLAQQIRVEAGCKEIAGVPGPEYWLLGDGRTLYDHAQEIDAAARNGDELSEGLRVAAARAADPS